MSTRKTVFLSASIPTKGREPFFSEFEERSAYYRRNIREAVLALVGVCYEFDFDLVFGGHPAITPLVHRAARSLGHDFGRTDIGDANVSNDQMKSQGSEHLETQPDRSQWKIVVYQSMYFQNMFPAEVRDFQRRHTGYFASVEALADFQVPKSPKEIDPKAAQLNIAAMRDRMINDFKGHYVCGVFMGGMEGIIDEFYRFGKYWPEAPRFPLTSTGGATAIGWQSANDESFLVAIPESHPRPPQARLFAQIQDDQALRLGHRHLLDTAESEPIPVTFRTLFRRLLGDGFAERLKQ